MFSDSETADRWMMVGLLCEFWLPFFFSSFFSYISPQANVSLTENTLSSTENDFLSGYVYLTAMNAVLRKSMYPLPDFALSKLGLIFAP